ncbi:MAG: hypothetical protein KA371_05765 [Acidobacteria bacterium]|nr:hypothetical protein [Acidobacteriota bacterium]
MARHLRRLPFLVVAAIGAAVTSLAAQAPTTGAGRSAPRAGVTVPTAARATAQNNKRPSDTELAFPVYPSAVYLRSYDAGRGQKYHLFGSTVPFADLVAYYRNVLGEKGNLVFEVPPTYMFEMGRFREETMAFPPGVTVKDYTFSGSAGYPNPENGGTPERFPTIIQIVPPPSTGAPE